MGWRTKYYEALEECLSLSKQLASATQQVADMRETLMNERTATNERIEALQKGCQPTSNIAVGRNYASSSHSHRRSSTMHAIPVTAPQSVRKPQKMQTVSPATSEPDATGIPWTAIVRERFSEFKSNGTTDSRVVCQRAFEFLHLNNLKKNGPGCKATKIPFDLVDEFKQFMEETLKNYATANGEHANNENEGEHSESGFESDMEAREHKQSDRIPLYRSGGSSSTRSKTRFSDRKRQEQQNDGFESHPSSPRIREDPASSPYPYGESSQLNESRQSETHARFRLNLESSSSTVKRTAGTDVKQEGGLVQKKARMQAPDYQQEVTHFEPEDTDKGSDSESKCPESEPVAAAAA
ncbi:hypothetical protein BJ741DRAFT_624718 [Chytriomyces cf. hyalinus JEL632]|nr:hypothetical protein BJ741DRAFT_624718 [Chytriomyces cf. hyalinus JEL632]